MSYVLVYSDPRGDEFSDRCASLDDLNVAIRSLHDSITNFVILRIEEDHDGPRTWQIEYPPAPPAGTRMRAVPNLTLTVDAEGRVELDGVSYSWREALEQLGPFTEAVEAEVEAAARRLRERLERDGTLNAGGDANIVLRHVLNGGTL